MAEQCSLLSSFFFLYFISYFHFGCREKVCSLCGQPYPMFALKIFPPLQRLLVAFIFFPGGLPSPPLLSGGSFPCDKNIFLGRTLSHPGKPVLAQGILRSLTSRGIPSPARKGRGLCHSSEANFKKLQAGKRRLKVSVGRYRRLRFVNCAMNRYLLRGDSGCLNAGGNL